MVILDYYRIFYFVAQYKSFTKAAEMLDNSQPNITRCMNNLENELECQLFVRSNRGVALTPEGRKLYEHISVAYERIVRGEEEIRKKSRLESGLISIGASETALRLMLLDKLEEFHEKYPHVRLRILNYSTPQAVTALENGLVDFAVATTPLKLKGALERRNLYSFREILTGGPKYRSFASEIRNLEQLRELPLISLGKESGTRELYMQYFLHYNLSFRPELEAATTDQILPMIQHNLGIGFLPEELAAEAIARGEIVQIPLEEPTPERNVCLLWDGARPQSMAVKRLIHILEEGSGEFNKEFLHEREKSGKIGSD